MSPAWDLMAHSFVFEQDWCPGVDPLRVVYDHPRSVDITMNHSKALTAERLLLTLTAHIFRS